MRKPLMAAVGAAIMIAGGLAAFVGGVMILIAAFRESVLWGLLLLLLTPATLLFVAFHWEETKQPFFIQLGGLGAVLFGLVIAQI